MDAQLKYRLTGAVILVLLAVLFVPELLTGPKPSRPTTDAAPAPTSADGAPLRSYDIDLSEPGPGAGDEPSGPVATPAPAATPAATAPAEPPPAAAPRGAASAAGRPASAPAGSPVVPDTGAKAPSAAASPAAPVRGFAVQVGSFASRDSADRLAGELRSRRFQTFVSPTRSSGRQMFRVRVGPVADRASAQALATRLAAAGQAGKVVSLP